MKVELAKRISKYAKDTMISFNIGNSELQFVQIGWNKSRLCAAVSHVARNPSNNFSLLTKWNGKGV